MDKLFSRAFEAEENSKDAVLRSSADGETAILENGAQVFSNRKNHIFSRLPEELEGKHYIRTSIDNSSAQVLKDGYVYVITPKEGEKNSVALDLINKGFENTSIPHFQVFPALQEEITVLRKYVETGEKIEYGLWGITFADVCKDYEPPSDPALQAPPVNTSPGPKYADSERLWQGIPSIEKASNGRLWATWYSGGSDEGEKNYVLLVTSDDDGQTWSDPKVVVDSPGSVRAFDSSLWIDPQNRLWFFWNQSYQLFDGCGGVWAIITENPDAEVPIWSEPKRLANGIMMNKPTVLSTGQWLMPAAVWNRKPYRPDMDDERSSNAYISTNKGETWTLYGSAVVPKSTADEHMIIERQDHSLWMLVRTSYGIGESFSYDGGKTWSTGKDSYIPHPSSRFHIRRLSSGKLLLIHHHHFKKRDHLTASLSYNDGKTWSEHLLLDERDDVSYPDATEDGNGKIYVTYDRSRYGEKEILMATFTEVDIRAEEFVSREAQSKAIINKLI